MYNLDSKKAVLATAEEVLAVLELQAAGYTKLTIPAPLQVDLEQKRSEVQKLRNEVLELEKHKAEFETNDESQLTHEVDITLAEVLKRDDVELLVDLLNASQLTTTPRLRRKLLINTGNNPETYQLSGVNANEFSRLLIYRLNRLGQTEVFERLLDEIARYLPPSLTDRVLRLRHRLETNTKSENFEVELDTLPISSTSEVSEYTETLAAKVMETHINFLDGVGKCFQKTVPSGLDDEYVKAVEKLLNELEFRAYESKWSLELQDILFESLCLVGELASTVKQHPNEARSKEFYRTARQLGRVLTRVHWRDSR